VLVSRLIILAIITLLTNGMIFGSTIKTKDGKTLEGEIVGLVLVKDVSDREWRKYYILDSEEILAIDEAGIHLSGNCLVRRLHCIREDPRLKDEDAVKYIQDHFELDESGEIKTFPLSGVLDPCAAEQYFIHLHLLPEVKILGRFVPKEGKLHLLPSLKITTQKGSIELPVTEIIEFTKK